MKPEACVAPDSVDLRELVRTLWEGRIILLVMTGLCLSAAGVFTGLMRDRITVTYELTLNTVPPGIWLQCGGDGLCRETALTQLLAEHAPAGGTVKTSQGQTKVSFSGRNSDRLAIQDVVQGMGRRVTEDWRLETVRWKEATGRACPGSGRGTEVCAGLALMVARAETGSLLTVSAADVRRRYPPGVIIPVSVLAGLMAGVALVLLRKCLQQARHQ